MKLEFSQRIFENPHIKFHEHLSSRNRVIPFGRKGGRTDGQTWRNFSPVSSNCFVRKSLVGKFVSSYFSGLSASVEMHCLSFSLWNLKVTWGRRLMGETCCVGLLLLERSNGWVGEWTNKWIKNMNVNILHSKSTSYIIDSIRYCYSHNNHL